VQLSATMSAAEMARSLVARLALRQASSLHRTTNLITAARHTATRHSRLSAYMHRRRHMPRCTHRPRYIHLPRFTMRRLPSVWSTPQWFMFQHIQHQDTGAKITITVTTMVTGVNDNRAAGSPVNPLQDRLPLLRITRSPCGWQIEQRHAVGGQLHVELAVADIAENRQIP